MTMLNLFRGWPADRIAQVYVESSNSIPPDGTVCQKYWKISPVNALAGILGWPRKCEVLPGADGNLQQVFRELPRWRRALVAVARYSWSGRFVEPAREMLYGVRSLLNPSLTDWIRRFSPEVVYSMLGTVHIIKLSLDVAKEFDLPIVPHFTDDWVTSNYQRCWGGGILRSRMQRHLEGIWRRSPIRLTISESMTEEYARRYGGTYETFVHCVDSSQFSPSPRRTGGDLLEREPGNALPADSGAADHKDHVGYSQSNAEKFQCQTTVRRSVRLLYLGGLHSERWRSLQEIGLALKEIANDGYPCELLIYTQPDASAQFASALMMPPAMRVVGWMPNAQVPELVCRADILIHVESFEPRARQYVALSMSTKIPEYMMAGRCIFAYGPAEVASMKYLARTGAGVTVGVRDTTILRSRLAELVISAEKREQLGAKARTVALDRHEATRERERFRKVFEQVRDGAKASSGRPHRNSVLSA